MLRLYVCVGVYLCVCVCGGSYRCSIWFSSRCRDTHRHTHSWKESPYMENTWRKRKRRRRGVANRSRFLCAYFMRVKSSTGSLIIPIPLPLLMLPRSHLFLLERKQFFVTFHPCTCVRMCVWVCLCVNMFVYVCVALCMCVCIYLLYILFKV